jgi:hypothetical protein
MNDEILMSKYTSDTWQSFHEGTIAPVLNNTTQNMTLHFFSDKELGYENRIVSSVNNISFMSAGQKAGMVKLALDGALYNRNEIREWFGDTPIEGGDVYQYSKNFTENTNQNKDKKEGNDGSNSESGDKTNPTDAADAV